MRVRSGFEVRYITDDENCIQTIRLKYALANPSLRHRSGLPTDYSTPYQCLGYSGLYGGYSNTSTTSATNSSSPAVSSAEGSPPSTATAGEENRVACRHVYCLGCQWLVNGEFRVLHPVEIRDETDYSAYGYGSQYGQQSGQQESSSGASGRRGRGHGARRSGG